MTDSDPGPAAIPEPGPTPAPGRGSDLYRVARVDGIPMSALVAEAPEPRAVVVALHGGATTSAYFDCPKRPDLSLVRLGAAVGFTVVALDRPGYGASAPWAAGMASPARRVDLAYAAVDALLPSRPRGAGVFLMAHSLGCELGIRMAGDKRGADLLGLELAGTGRRYHQGSVDVLAATKKPGASRAMRIALRDVLWGARSLYPPGIHGGAVLASAAPAYEAEARTFSQDFGAFAERVRVPVQYTLGAYESVWSPGPEALADVAALFTASPRVAVNEQADSPHNLSVGLTARAYHLKVLAFAEQCAVARENAEPWGRDARASGAVPGPGPGRGGG
ncbi:alpha/beta fold hydrolase [Yinghuangia sp. ASG 101]|uniref:alpha/beta hydrolase n=1 Tax=Yinghuangia sp. ASG 101 TaxID=2896848 RepID=UPI001E613F5D|nr:alpha/beta hydrolase [Yinghuangia sp. ASG 101]UGQ15067.1 alpha/beta fold hydrolase [Yinghuangia sp. ASG 101]